VVEFQQSGFTGDIEQDVNGTGASADTSSKRWKSQRGKRKDVNTANFKITSSPEQSDISEVHASSRKKFVCKHCHKTYTSQKGLDYHLGTKHRSSEVLTICINDYYIF
jgi:hypothetical protein